MIDRIPGNDPSMKPLVTAAGALLELATECSALMLAPGSQPDMHALHFALTAMANAADSRGMSNLDLAKVIGAWLGAMAAERSHKHADGHVMIVTALESAADAENEVYERLRRERTAQ